MDLLKILFEKRHPNYCNVLLGVVPSSYYELKFKVGEKWYRGYYEHLWGGSFRAFACWTKHCSRQTHFERSEVSEWHYT
jgi:hypothetical protein